MLDRNAEQRKKYAEKRAKGQCTKCGNPSPSRAMCQSCREKHAKHNRKVSKRYEEEGRCKCGRPKVTKERGLIPKLCPVCSESKGIHESLFRIRFRRQ